MTPTPSCGFRTVLFALLLILGCELASCTPANPSPAADPSDPRPTVTVPLELPVIISLAGRFTNQTLSVLDEQIAAFEAANPDISVEVVRAPRDSAQRRKWVEARLGEKDTSIDIYVLDATWPADLAAGGGLASLDGRLAAQGARSEAFLEGTLEANRVDGHQVALPWTADTGLLYYRRDLLDRYGHAAPTTWEDLQEISYSVKAAETMRHGFVWPGAADEDLTCNTLEHLWSHGPEQSDTLGSGLVNHTGIHDALAQMRELVDSGASPSDVAAYDRWAAQSAFREGDAVFLRDWFSAWKNLSSSESPMADQTGLAPLPTGCLGGQSLGLSAYSTHPDKAYQLMTFLTGYEQQVQLATSGGQLPSLEAVYSDQDVLAALPILKVLRAAFSVAEPRPSLMGYYRISAVVYTEVNKMLANQQDVMTTADNIDLGIQPLLR